MSKPVSQELRLNVSYFYRDDETRRLITAEDATQLNCPNDDIYYSRGEKYYECYFCKTFFQISRSTLLASLLFCTLAVAVIMVTVVLLCTFASLSSDFKPFTNFRPTTRHGTARNAALSPVVFAMLISTWLLFYKMRLLTLAFVLATIILSISVSVSAFVVPPTGMCYVGAGENCLRCDCKKPLKCYKGVCR